MVAKADSLKTWDDKLLKYSWAPGIIAFPAGGGRLQIRKGQRGDGIEIEAPGENHLLPFLGDALREPVSLIELCKRLPETAPTIVTQTLRQLVDHGYVVDSQSTTHKGEDSKSSFKIRLMGEANLVADVRNGPVSVDLTAEIPEWSDVREMLLTAPAHFEQILGTYDRTILVVAVSGGAEEICRQLGRCCAATGTHWALFRCSNGCFEVGPLIVPGETACFDCLMLRTLAAAQECASEHGFRRYLEMRPEHERQSNSGKGIAQLAAAVLGTELESFCEQGGNSGICNGVWLVESSPLRLRLQRLLKVPGCPTCALGRNRFVSISDD